MLSFLGGGRGKEEERKHSKIKMDPPTSLRFANTSFSGIAETTFWAWSLNPGQFSLMNVLFNTITFFYIKNLKGFT